MAAFAARLHLTLAAPPVARPGEALGGVHILEQLIILQVLQRQDHDADVHSHPTPVAEGAPKEAPAASRLADVAHCGSNPLSHCDVTRDRRHGRRDPLRPVDLPVAQAMDTLG